MPEQQIRWTLNIQVVGGPTISESKLMPVEAYDKIEVTIDPGATDKEVEIQPGGAGQVKFLVISSDKYDETKLTYKVNDKASTTIINLDAPQLLIGKGAVGLLTVGLITPAPQKLLFTSTMGDPAAIKILVGRNATP